MGPKSRKGETSQSSNFRCLMCPFGTTNSNMLWMHLGKCPGQKEQDSVGKEGKTRVKVVFNKEEKKDNEEEKKDKEEGKKNEEEKKGQENEESAAKIVEEGGYEEGKDEKRTKRPVEDEVEGPSRPEGVPPGLWCSICGGVFNSRPTKALHMKKAHWGGGKIPRCSKCHMVFSSVGTRNRHVRFNVCGGFNRPLEGPK